MKEKLKSELESLIKKWSLGSSAESKYRVEAYQELLDFVDSLEEPKKVEDGQQRIQ